jgi:DNA polymerase I-like protein with 3'-5' exonuclease and polymerase domains
MLNVAIRLDRYVVGWNVSFDAAWCIAVGLEEEVFKVKWLDAMLLWRHAVVEPEGEDVPASKRKSYALKAAMDEFYPTEAGFKDFEDFQATDAASLAKLLHRNKMDALWTLRLAEKFWGMLNDTQRQAALIEARCIPLVAKTKVIGLVSSVEAAQALSDVLAAEAVALYRELLETSPEVRGINLGSPKQLQKLLYETWGLTADRFSRKTQDPSTDKYALFDLAAVDYRAHLLKKLREAKNNRTKYAEGTIKSLGYNGDGCVRPQAKIFSTYTSRITYGSSDKATIQEQKNTKKSGLVTVTRKVEVPVGVALHQWKRGKDYRRLIMPPEGYDLAEFDFMGQEFRWMAAASGDETMLGLCAPGEDAHAYMGAQIAQVDYRALVAAVKAGDKAAANERKCGKFCIAEGELVLTDRGLVPIEKVLLADRVWDGVDWVNHEGLIYQGTQEVITYAGLTATPDHMVYLEDGRICKFGWAAEAACRLTQTGDGGHTVRVADHLINKGFKVWEEGRSEGLMHMRRVQQDCLGKCHQSKVREVREVQGVCVEAAAPSQRTRGDQRCGDGQGSEEVQRDEAEVLESEGSKLQELRSEGDRVQVCDGCSGDCLRARGVATPNILKGGYRPARQRRTLRAGESQVGNKVRELKQQEGQQGYRSPRQGCPSYSCVPCAEDSAPRGAICGIGCSEPGIEWADHGPDRAEVEHPKLQTKRTYDLANAGPRHRFTVSNCLISNCNLSYQYRVSARTATVKARIDYELAVDETFIKQTQSIYKQSYPGVGGTPGQRIGGYWASQIQKCRQLGYAETFAGRRVQLKGNWAGREAWPLESTSINYPIQGTGGDQKYLALAVLRTILPKYEAHFYYELHDGLFVIIPNRYTQYAVPAIKKALSNLPYKQAWGVNLPIQFPVDSKVGPSWGDLSEVE